MQRVVRRIGSRLVEHKQSAAGPAVAEGVETADQAAILKELGCDLAQGYYFDKPLPSEAMERLLAEGTSY